MLRLEYLELMGFKSFADRTRLTFPAGVTCVVGPNGCGKSNVVDAFAWVLGEQSAKTLRGERMEDVIFSGSKTRKPQSHAEVILSWVQLEALPSESPGRLVFGRRLFRNGFSEYTLNQEPCRLKDIQTALMDFGMGTRTYSIVEQGRVSQILDSKPVERRHLIEEAAGILKYKVRRRESEIKLREAEENLLRINDITQEVKKQRGHLQRQVGKARRYRDLKERRREAAVRVLEYDLYHHHQQLRRLHMDYDQARMKEGEVAGALGRVNRDLTVNSEKTFQMQKELRELESAFNSLTREISLNEERMGFARERIKEREAAVERIKQEQTRAEAERLALEERKRDALKEQQRVQADLISWKEKERVLSSRAEASAEQGRGLRSKVAAERNQLAAIEKQALALEREQAGLTSQIEANEKALEASGQRLQAAQSLLNELNQQQGQQADAVTQARAKRSQSEELLQGVNDELGRSRGKLEQLKGEFAALDGERMRLENQVISLQGILKSRQGVKDETKALLRRLDVSRLVGDTLECGAGFEKALDWCLEEILGSVVMERPDTLNRILTMVNVPSCRVLDVSVPTAELPAVPVLKDATSWADLLHGDDEVLAALESQLRMSFVVGDRDTAIRLGPRFPHLRFVDGDGTVQVQGPCIWLRGGRENPSGWLTLKAEIARLQAQLETSLQRSKEMARALESQQALCADRERDRNLKKAQLDQAERECVVAEQQQLALGERLNGLRKEINADQERLKASQDQVSEHRRRLEELTQSLEATGRHLQECRRQLAQSEASLETHGHQHEEITRELAGLLARVEGKEQMAAKLDQDMSQMLKAEEDLSRRGAEYVKQLAQSQEDISLCRRDVRTLEQGMGEALQQRQHKEQLLKAKEEELQTHQETQSSLEEARRQLQSRRDDLRAEQGRYELEEARMGSNMAHWQENYRSASGQLCEVDLLQSEDILSDEAVAQTREQLEQLQKSISALGPVNLLAIDEFEEVNHRYGFLVDQQKDLLDSVAEIRATIHALDEKSTERFLEAYQSISERFGRIFAELFGGGRAWLRLADEDQVLESGIDMMIQPPGKRLQNALLMSGGEKALTAISLLLAAFEYRPAPFCLLDEVDAPLDEANVIRFVRKLDDMKALTQFIVITHQKQTMAGAAALLGVTMEDDGCSKLVSVRLD